MRLPCNILALIRGSAVNQSGRSSGITVPNAQAQQAVIRKALKAAGVKPAEVSYVEAHGTGTSLGDPIEVQALGAVFGEGRPEGQRLAIGSVKTNIGHLEPAAGVASLIKVVLALQHKEIPPNLNLKEINSGISLQDIPVVIPTERFPWPAAGGPRIAGVNSFGASGTNAHVVLEEAPVQNLSAAEVECPLHLLCLSAKNEEALKQLASRFESYLATHAEMLGNVCFTANTGRSHFAQRLAVVAGSSQQMCEKLAAFVAAEEAVGAFKNRVQGTGRPKVVFLFTGQGAQYVGMGRQLYETQLTFRRALEQCDVLLRPYLEQPLLSVLYPETGTASPLDETAYTQPALFALEYALAKLWQSWGVEPTAVLGHSVGEYVAACVAGVFSLEDGLKLIAQRAQLMQALPQGGEMAAVFANEAQVAAAIAPYANEISIAAINGPENIVISGAGQAVQKVLKELEVHGIRSKSLTVSHAFHSPLMEPMLDTFEQTAAQVSYAPPQIELISNVTGRLADGNEITKAAYWRSHVREAVRFSTGMKALHEQGYKVFVEIGPSPTLLGMAKRFLPEEAGIWLPSLTKGQDDWQQMLQSLGALYVHGLEVDWFGLDRDYLRRRVALPTYPFQKKRYWLEIAHPQERRTTAVPAPVEAAPSPVIHSLLGRRLPSPLEQIQFETQLSTDLQPYLSDFAFEGLTGVNIGVYVEMAFAAAAQTFGIQTCLLENVFIRQALVLEDGVAQTVQLILTPEDGEMAAIQFFSQPSGKEQKQGSWILHAGGIVRIEQNASNGSCQERFSLKDVQARCQEKVSGSEFYRKMWKRKVYLGPAAQWNEQIWRRDGEALSRMRLPQEDETNVYSLHPGLIDACFQLVYASVPANLPQSAVYMLISLESFWFYGHSGTRLWCHVRLRPGNDYAEALVADIHLVDEAGQLVAKIEGAHLKRASREAILHALKSPAPASVPKASRQKARDVLLAAKPAQRQQLLQSSLLEQVAAVLGFSASELDAQESLHNLGLDSLLAIELNNRLQADLGVALPLVMFLEGSSIAELTTQILAQLPDPDTTSAHVDLVREMVLSKDGIPVQNLKQVMAVAASNDWEEGTL